MYIKRRIEASVLRCVETMPVTAIIGPRQCGKSTLVKNVFHDRSDVLYLDLERPSDLEKLNAPEWFLSTQKSKLICIDEIQRKPELFPLIRSLVDEWNRPGCFVVLGSASRDLLNQSSESLAGRIVYKRLTPFLFDELSGDRALERYIVRGAFPRSLFAIDDGASHEWRESFITTFLERDLRLWSSFSTTTMMQLWRMLAHLNGQTVNYSTLASSLGVSSVSVKRYTELLASTYMVEIVRPYFSNLGKRMVKAPKIYVADSGITTALLKISSFEDLSGHPGIGALWEQVVLSNLIGNFPDLEIFFYRSASKSEIDFVINHRGRIFCVECKSSLAPRLSRGNLAAIQDIRPESTFVVVPGDEHWSMRPGVEVTSLPELINELSLAGNL